MLVKDTKKTKAQLLEEMEDLRTRLNKSAARPEAEPAETTKQVRDRIDELERDNKNLRAQLADQRSSTTVMASGELMQPERKNFRVLAIVLFVLTVLFLLAALWLYFGRVIPMERELAQANEQRDAAVHNVATLQAANLELQARLTPAMIDQLYFPSGRTGLTAAQRGTLRNIIPTLRSRGDKGILLVGYADDRKILSTYRSAMPSNWELSAHRAAAVARFLIADGGLPAEKMEVSGMGQTRPAGDNGTAEGRAKNRRVEIFVRK
jgi:flagellar motor protein MotB